MLWKLSYELVRLFLKEVEFVLFVVFEGSLGGGGLSFDSFFFLSLSLEVSLVLLAFFFLRQAFVLWLPLRSQ